MEREDRPGREMGWIGHETPCSEHDNHAWNSFFLFFPASVQATSFSLLQINHHVIRQTVCDAMHPSRARNDSRIIHAWTKCQYESRCVKHDLHLISRSLRGCCTVLSRRRDTSEELTLLATDEVQNSLTKDSPTQTRSLSIRVNIRNACFAQPDGQTRLLCLR